MSRLFARPIPDWTDREAGGEFAPVGAKILGDDPVAARLWDRTPGTAPALHMANQMGTVFSRLDCTPRWRERLAGIEVPTLVVHGHHNRFFPVGNGEAIARETPNARLLVLKAAATVIPDAAAGEVAPDEHVRTSSSGVAGSHRGQWQGVPLADRPWVPWSESRSKGRMPGLQPDLALKGVAPVIWPVGAGGLHLEAARLECGQSSRPASMPL